MSSEVRYRQTRRLVETEELRADLRSLLDAVKAGEVGFSEFSVRLDAIHRAHLGDDANLPEPVAARRKAVSRHADHVRSIERHHTLERLARALGVGSARERSARDGH